MPIWPKLSSMHCHTAGQRTEWNSSKKQKLREEISRPSLTWFHDSNDYLPKYYFKVIEKQVNYVKT